MFDRADAATIDGFGLTHDGHSSGLSDFLRDPLFTDYSASQKTDISAYELCFDTGTAPAVGFTITLTSATVTNASAQTGWATLESQASAGNISLIGRGTIQGKVHGLLYQPSTNNYISDTNALYTQAQLQTLILAGDTMSMMGVYPGTGSASTQP